MNTQKETIKNFFSCHLDKTFKLCAIGDWLEDINWHSEHAIFMQSYVPTSRYEYVQVIRELNMAINPSNYSASFVRSLLESNDKLRKISQEFATSLNPIIIYKGYSIHRDEIADYNTSTKMMWALSNVYGWGLDGSWKEWRGQAFVDELAQLLELKPISKVALAA